MIRRAGAQDARARSDPSSNPSSTYKAMTSGKSFHRSTSETSPYFNCGKHEGERSVPAGRPKALTVTTCSVVNSKCPKEQFQFANPGQYCFQQILRVTLRWERGSCSGDTSQQGSGHPQLAPPEQRWTQPPACLAPPHSIHLQLCVLRSSGVKVHGIRPNRRQGDSRQPQTELTSVLPEAENSSSSLAGCP